MSAHINDCTTTGRWRGLSAVLTVATTMLLLVGTSAGAAAQQPPWTNPYPYPSPYPLYPAGTEIKLNLETSESPTIRLFDTADPEQHTGEQALSLGSLAGSATFLVTATDPKNPGSATLKMTEFSMTTTEPAAATAPADAEQGVGEVTIEMSDTAVTPDSLLKMTSQSPPNWEHVIPLCIDITIERPPSELRPEAAAEQANEPLALTTRGPAHLIAKLSSFPPKGDLYGLQDPIGLTFGETPNGAVGELQGFSVIVNHS
jgi:hypothetical protein